MAVIQPVSAHYNPPPNKALQLSVKGRTPIGRGKVWRRTSALRPATVAALAGS
jgi:hypothetical protein